jgi:hypothetical protein
LSRGGRAGRECAHVTPGRPRRNGAGCADRLVLDGSHRCAATVNVSVKPSPELFFGDLGFRKWFVRNRQYAAVMMDTNDSVAWEPPVAGDELATLTGSLERQRRTLEWKCAGLAAPGMRATVGVSSVTLGGLLKHLALVEDHTFAVKLNGRRPPAPWDTVDWDADPDWEWHSAADDSPEQLLALWRDAVARSREAVAEALADNGLDRLGPAMPDGRQPSLRRLLIDLVEEYARHVGHADLIRESVDGLVGEDPPR